MRPLRDAIARCFTSGAAALLIGCSGPSYTLDLQNASATEVSAELVSMGAGEREALWTATLAPGSFVSVGPETVDLARTVRVEVIPVGIEDAVPARKTLARGRTTMAIEQDGRGVMLRVLDHGGSLGRLQIRGE